MLKKIAAIGLGAALIVAPVVTMAQTTPAPAETPAAAATPTDEEAPWPQDPGAPAAATNGHGTPGPTLVRPAGAPVHQVPHDPGMN